MPKKPASNASFSHPKYWLIWVGYGVARSVGLLPFSWQIGIGRGLGSLMYRFAKKRRHIVEVNVNIAFDELSAKERTALVERIFTENGIGFIESIIAWWSPKEKLTSRVRYEGVEHLQAAHAKNKGVLLVAAHYSSLEVGGVLISEHTTMDAIYRRHDNPLMEKLITDGRLSYCNAVIERRDIRSVLKSLRKNHCVWYAPDQDMGKDTSVFVPFFGHQAATLTATSRLASLNGSPVIICAYHREADGFYKLSFSPPVTDFPTDNPETDAARINELLEACIRQHPEQYLWLHKRYKTQPEGRNKLYQ